MNIKHLNFKEKKEENHEVTVKQALHAEIICQEEPWHFTNYSY